MSFHPASSWTLMILIGCAFGSNLTDLKATDEPTTTDLSALLSKVREQFHAPGVAAAVTRGGQLLAIGVSGVRGLDLQEPVAKSDRSMIGSC